MQTIRPGSAAEWESVRELFREYWGSFGFSACFQDFESEVAGLPGAYAPPYAASTRNAARPSGCTCAQSFAGGAWGARCSIGWSPRRAGWDTAR